MSTKNVTGILRDAAGHPIGNATIRFIATSTRSIVNTVITDYSVAANGSYSCSVLFGVYNLQIKRQDEVAFRTVCANTYIHDSVDQTLESLISAQKHIQEIDESLIQEMLGILAQTDADAAASSAAASSAASSASTAATKASEASASAASAANSASTATTKASEAASSATNAASSASTATTKANAASTSATSAASSASTAATKASEASASAANAASSASEATQSAAIAAGALIEAGPADMSTGVYPQPIQDALGQNRSCFWKVTVGGTVSGVTYGVGDSLVYSKEISGYYKINNTESVTSVNGMHGVVTITKATVALGNVDNTSDVNKPISTATQAALDGKLAATANAVSASKWATARTISLTGDASGSVSLDGSADVNLAVTVADDSHAHTISNVDGLQTALNGKLTDGGSHDTVYLSNWFRSTGTTGWYNQTYSGGINMIDSTWIRTYGNKKFLVDNTSADAIYTLGGVKADGGFYDGANRVYSPNNKPTVNDIQSGVIWTGEQLSNVGFDLTNQPSGLYSLRYRKINTTKFYTVIIDYDSNTSSTQVGCAMYSAWNAGLEPQITNRSIINPTNGGAFYLTQVRRVAG